MRVNKTIITHPYPPSEDASDRNNNIVRALSTNWAGVGYGVCECVTRRRRSHGFENATPTVDDDAAAPTAVVSSHTL